MQVRAAPVSCFETMAEHVMIKHKKSYANAERWLAVERPCLLCQVQQPWECKLSSFAMDIEERAAS